MLGPAVAAPGGSMAAPEGSMAASHDNCCAVNGGSAGVDMLAGNDN